MKTLEPQNTNLTLAPRYVCWICKRECSGEPAYETESMAGPFKYCHKCWPLQRTWRTPRLPSAPSTAAETAAFIVLFLAGLAAIAIAFLL